MNPYNSKGKNQFWRNAVALIDINDMLPISAKYFKLERDERIATAGSCFAQHIAQYLDKLQGLEFLQTEPVETEQPKFSAAYGNIYTVSQLRQLFEESFSIHVPPSAMWIRNDGRWIDGYRPTMFSKGFASPEEVLYLRCQHLNAVRQMFTTCSVFIFTLGLTESWVSTTDKTVFPLHPGIVTDSNIDTSVKFHNFSYQEILEDMIKFINSLHSINEKVKIILTVSPVPLTATYTDDHVLIANSYSKSVLRAICGQAEQKWPFVYYFPSFEIISGHYNKGIYYEQNKRTVTTTGVNHVMQVFHATYLKEFRAFSSIARDKLSSTLAMFDNSVPQEQLITCDEELFGTNIGF